MLIFNLPPNRATRGPLRRVGVLGSCRVKNPIKLLAKADDVSIEYYERPFSHTSAEALQCLRFFRRELKIPEYCAPFIFEREMPPATSAGVKRLVDTVDTFVVEVC